jgi:hypothetical protein
LAGDVSVIVGYGRTLTVNGSLSESEPSLTLKVITAEPVFPAAGVTLTVRFAPLPPNTMFASGIKAVSDDCLESDRLDEAVWLSAIVKLKVAVDPFTLIFWSAIAEIAGAVFPELVVVV